MDEDRESERVARKLIEFLREYLDAPSIAYRSPPTRLLGGFETDLYRFQLCGSPEAPGRPLVLRLYPEDGNPEGVVWETLVQNALSDDGHAVARVHFVCTDPSVLGGPFFVMDFLPGELLTSVAVEMIPVLLGQAHAELHQSDPKPVISYLKRHGIDGPRYRLAHRCALESDVSAEIPWVREAIAWLAENTPHERQELAICHGDFHPLNVLVQDTDVSGIVDWADFHVADPAWDIANTLLRLKMPFKYLVPSVLGAPFTSVDWDKLANAYLDGYRSRNAAGTLNLDYYRARQSVFAFVAGQQGHPVWGYPSVAKDLMEWIRRYTGVRIASLFSLLSVVLFLSSQSFA